MGAPSVPPGFAAAAVGLAAAAMALPLHRPRARRALLLTVVPALALVAAILPLLFGGTATAFRAALVLAATAAVAVLAALRFPRLSTFALLLSGAALLGAGSVEPRPLWIALLGLSLVVAALLARSERFGLRVALSLWGAAFLARAHPALDGPLREAAIALVLLAGGLLVERPGPRPPPPGGREPAPGPP
jgi:hypothetical protein